jgi:hypothetical protein
MAGDPLTGPDGTQEPPPPPWLPDPLAGLVTSEDLDVGVHRVAVPKPPKLPDATGIREALDAVLSEESRRPVRPSPVFPRASPRRPARQWPSAASVARALRATRDRPQRTPEREPAGMRTGMSVVMVIVLITAVILFYVIRSLADTFSQLFG